MHSSLYISSVSVKNNSLCVEQDFDLKARTKVSPSADRVSLGGDLPNHRYHIC